MHVKNRLGKRGAAVLVALTLAIGLSSCGFADTSASPPADPYTNVLFQALNNDRAAAGLPRLTWSPKLANLAGSWAYQMSQVGSLYHQDLGGIIYSADFYGYYTLGENILVGPHSIDAGSVESAWMASPPHRANIMSRSFNVVGIGWYWGPDGRLWAVQDFGGI